VTQTDFAGIPIILTADRILLADYPTLLDGMTAASQTSGTPAWLMRRFVSPPAPVDGFRARKAPLGLRLLEAALREAGFSAAEVAVVPPEELRKAIGERTRLVAISSGDPLGLGMNDSTMSAIADGLPYAPLWLAEMCAQLREIKKGLPNFKIILGGPGVWQVEQNPAAGRQLGIDDLCCGYAEEKIVALARAVLPPLPRGGRGGEALTNAKAALDSSEENLPPLPPLVKGGRNNIIPSILAPTNMGVVEVSRGCGLGCSFCTIRAQPMIHLPVEKIVRDVEVNVGGGATSVCLISEDFLRYGAENVELAPARVLELARAVRRTKGLRLIQLDHVNISSVVRFPAAELKVLHDLLVAGVTHDYLWMNLGVESASGALLAKNGGLGKILPHPVENWERLCSEAVDKLIAAGFTPMVSLVLGLPGEKEDDLRQTLRFVQAQRAKRLTIFPLFYAPINSSAKAFQFDDMTPLHWEIFRLAYAINFKWMPAMFWDNQRGAGVPWLKRVLIQGAGWLRMQDWRWRMWKRARLSEKTC
jgi:radical SAM superfamily enzyme YgiQ (UPF0313 family)